jgi:hypothetical protein
MFFNAYEIENCGTGKLVRFAFVRQDACSEVFQLYLPMEVLRNERVQIETFLGEIPDVPTLSKLAIPANSPRLFAPQFVNRIALARSLDNGEIGLHSICIHDIGVASKKLEEGTDAKEIAVSAIPVVLLHAELPLCALFCMELMENVKK